MKLLDSSDPWILTRHHKEKEMEVTAKAINHLSFGELWVSNDGKIKLKCFIVMVGLNAT